MTEHETTGTAVWLAQVTCVDVTLRLCRVASCRVELAGRRTAYCSDAHAREFEAQHLWPVARRVARRRARWACQRCGFKPSAIRKDPARAAEFARHELRLEVNHIEALRGSYRFVSCLNHADNLEVLCHRCHVETTNAGRPRAGDERAAPTVGGEAGGPPSRPRRPAVSEIVDTEPTGD